MRRVVLIAARAANGVIGRGGGLPWHLPDDLKRFKEMTRGHTLLMGRKTYQSLTGPLPERRLIVLTRDPAFAAGDATVVTSVTGGLAAVPSEDVFVAGGSRVYAAAFPHATHACLTDVHATVEGDTYFPDVDLSTWRLVREEHHAADARHAHAFTFRDYER